MSIKAERLTDSVTLYEGDCLEVLPTLAPGSVDAVVTDPPYGVELGKHNDQRRDGSHLGKKGYRDFQDTYEQFCNEVVPRLNVAIGMARRAAVFSGPNIHEQKKPDAIGGIYCPCAVGRTPWGFKNFLPVLLYGIAPDLHRGHRHTVLKSTHDSPKCEHPCAKPTEWMRWLVQLAARKGESILDPFAGSGTTAIAAMKEGRKCILIEKDPHYCEIIRRRVREADGTAPGTLFANVASVPDLFAGVQA